MRSPNQAHKPTSAPIFDRLKAADQALLKQVDEAVPDISGPITCAVFSITAVMLIMQRHEYAPFNRGIGLLRTIAAVIGGAAFYAHGEKIARDGFNADPAGAARLRQVYDIQGFWGSDRDMLVKFRKGVRGLQLWER